MDIDLDRWEPSAPASVDIRPVDHDAGGMRDYLELMRTYWSVPESAQELLHAFNQESSGDRTPGVRYVAYVDGAPVGKLFLNLVEAPVRVAVYGVAVRPEARGRGVATALMETALARGKDVGASRCVLHSSEMAVSLYRRMGFVERCSLLAYATGPLFGTHHH